MDQHTYQPMHAQSISIHTGSIHSYIYTGSQAYGHAGMRTYQHTAMPTGTQTDIHTDIETNRQQTDRPTDRHADTRTHEKLRVKTDTEKRDAQA